jgi:hypothetical protein
MSKPIVIKLACDSCESVFKVTFKEDEVSRNPIFCVCCGTEIDFDSQDDDGTNDDE